MKDFKKYICIEGRYGEMSRLHLSQIEVTDLNQKTIYFVWQTVLGVNVIFF